MTTPTVAEMLRDPSTAEQVAYFAKCEAQFTEATAKPTYNIQVARLVSAELYWLASDLRYSDDNSRDWKAERTKWNDLNLWADRVICRY